MKNIHGIFITDRKMRLHPGTHGNHKPVRIVKFWHIWRLTGKQRWIVASSILEIDNIYPVIF